MTSTRLDRVTTAFSRAVTRVGFWELFAIALALRLPAVIVRPPAALTENLRAGLTLARYGYLGDPFSLPTGTFCAGCPWRLWRPPTVLKITVIATILFVLAIAPYTVRNHQALGAWFR